MMYARDKKIIQLLSYEMLRTWIHVGNQQCVFDDSRVTFRAFDRMREALSMVVEPWRCEEYDLE